MGGPAILTLEDKHGHLICELDLSFSRGLNGADFVVRKTLRRMTVNPIYVVGSILSFLILLYLVVALLKPEIF
jgi:hypothetical protein